MDSVTPSDADAPSDDADLYARYRYEVTIYDREFRRWHDRSKKIVRRYKDERNAYEDNLSRFNILWSNVQTLQPMIYARVPKPAVTRRHHDADPIGRVAAMTLQRTLDFMVARTDFDEMARCVSMDVLLPGRGVAWVRYVPHFRDAAVKGNEEVRGEGFQTENNDTEPEQDEPLRVLDYEEAVPDYVNWEDYGHNVCRTWDEVRMVWRRTYLSRDELVERFGDIGRDVPLDYSPQKEHDEETPVPTRKATVIELWDKLTRKAVWFSREFSQILDERDDPLKLDGFFPCPMPIYTTLGNDSLIPVPDYAQYQDQANELDELTGRIGAIQKAIKAVGVYDASAEAVQRILAEGVENQLLPVEQWAMFAEKGGLKGVMEFVPMEDIMKTLLGLHQARDSVKQIIYEVTGMSDIIRGANDPNETATAVQSKSHFAMIRLVHKQRAMQRFLRDVMRIMGQIAAEHFEPETIKLYSGMNLMTNAEKQQVQEMLQARQELTQQAQQHGVPPPQFPPVDPAMQLMLDQPSWEEVTDLLKDNCLRNFHIEVETDSTLYENEEAEKSARMEFLQSMSQFLAQAVPGIQQTPQLAPLITDMMMFAVRSFRVGNEMEARFSETQGVMEKLAAAAPPPGSPSPEQQKMQAQNQAQMQIEQMKMQAQMEIEKQKMALDQQSRQQELQQKAQLAQVEQQAQAQEDAARNQMESQRDTVKMQQDATIKQMEMQHQKELETMRLQNQVMIEKMKLDHDAALQNQKMQQDAAIQAQTQQHESAMASQKMDHDSRMRENDRQFQGAVESAKLHSAHAAAMQKPQEKSQEKKPEGPREIVIKHIHDSGVQ